MRNWIGENLDGSFYCKLCGDELPKQYKTKYMVRKYHRPPLPGNARATRCQGQIARDHGHDIRTTEVQWDFNNNTHYGRVMYEQPGIIYEDVEGRAREVPSFWTVQFEDGDEFDFPAEDIEKGIRALQANPLDRRIVIPDDEGLPGHPGVLAGGEQGVEEEGMEEDEAEGMDEDEEEGMEPRDWSDGEESDYSEEDDEIDLAPDDQIFLAKKVSDRTGVNAFSHIYRVIENRKPNTTNTSIMDHFAVDMEDFDVNLPTSWSQLKRIFQVSYFPSLLAQICALAF